MVPLASVDGGSEPGAGRNTFVYTQSNVNCAVFVNDPKRRFPRLIARKGRTATFSDFSEASLTYQYRRWPSSFQTTQS